MSGGGGPGGPPEGGRPAWYHEDNLFETPERMAWAHAPIVAAAVEALAGGGGDVLDLGCGNGALLARIHAACPAAVPWGIELEADRVDHARAILPAFPGHVVQGDMFDEGARRPLDRPYALAILTPRRLQQGGGVAAASLLAWLRARARALLVYGYGRSLSEFGGLQGFAGRFGIRLARPAPDTRASLAARW